MDHSLFNLPDPADFRGLHPDLPVRMYQRKLPHWRQPGATYFVTFRLHDSIPREKLEQLQRWRSIWEKSHPPPRTELQWHEFAKEITQRTEEWMDGGHGSCYFRHEPHANLMAEACLHQQHQRQFTSCFCVMANHVHAVVKPLGDYELEDILDSWKGFVGSKINRELGRRGPLWEPEIYDRIVRDAEHLFRVVQYIGNNPAKAGVPRDQWRRWICPVWQASGWDFRDGN